MNLVHVFDFVSLFPAIYHTGPHHCTLIFGFNELHPKENSDFCLLLVSVKVVTKVGFYYILVCTLWLFLIFLKMTFCF